jgi:NADPH-dependent 2,4-dienoyl-CoA reductase/sulfur reductase-like enzyme
MPIAPSATLSGYLDHRVPHVLDADEVSWLVREYRESAALAAEAGADALELHANHDDVLQWFMSPLTNRRQDGYGGSFENRRRFVREVVEAMRASVERPITLGLRLCLDEMIEGGYTIEGCQEIVAAFTADGTLDYFSFDVGGNWGAISYIPPGTYGDAEWAALAGQAKQATHLPTVYVGRVFDVATAEQVLDTGHADLVGMARATIADPSLVTKTRHGLIPLLRPCMGVNDCIDRRVVEGLEFACAANPYTGREHLGLLTATANPRSALVVGAGPAGLELAGLLAERGHEVVVWERSKNVGGQLALAATLRMNGRYGKWIDWQQSRLERLGVIVRLEMEATPDLVLAHGADAVATATGVTSRHPDATGLDLPHVATVNQVLTGEATLGHRVLVVSEDDRVAPLSVADHLSGIGHQVTVIYRSPAPSPLVGKYTIGAILSRLDSEGVELIPMARLVAVDTDGVTLANTYSDRRWRRTGFDSVVLACGAVGDDSLYQSLRSVHANVHLLGDAYAPRRVVSATRQAMQLAIELG